MGFIIKRLLIWLAIMSNRVFGRTKIYKKMTDIFLSPLQNEYLDKLVLKNSLFGKSNKTREDKRGRTIYFDVSVYMFAKKKSGIQRVVSKFIEYLPEIARNNGYILKYISDIKGYRQVEYVSGSWIATYDIEPAFGDVYLSFDLPAYEILKNKNQVSTWKKNGCKLVFCVYDLCFVKYPEFVRYANSVSILGDWLKFVLSNSDGIITDSKTVMKEVEEWAAGTDSDPLLKYGYFHLGSDFKRKDIRAEHSVFTFIAVSTIEPRKGYADLIQAYSSSECAKKNTQLVIVGRKGWKCDEIIKEMENSPLYNKNIFWYSDCSDKELEELYSQSDVYVSASYYEGFGLGIVEATSYSLPLIMRDIPVNREIAGENALYFTNEKSLARVMDCCYNGCYIENKIQYLDWHQSVQMAFDAIRGMGLLC